MKLIRYLFFVICTILVIWYLNYRFVILQNSINYDTISQNHGFDNDIGGYKSQSDSKSPKQHRPDSGIQMSEMQFKLIGKVLPEKANVLVWGLAKDCPYWHSITEGNVFFLEDDTHLRKDRILWYDKIVKKYPLLEVYRVHYTAVKAFERYINNPKLWPLLDLRDQLPVSVIQMYWHVIIVNIPSGCFYLSPRRCQSIYTSGMLAKEGTHIFVDNFECKVEHDFSVNVFGKPYEVIKRQITNSSHTSAQAHFVLRSNNQKRSGHGNSTSPLFLIPPVQRIDQNRTDSWIILLTVNNGFFDFFTNWRWHFQQLNMPMPIYVIAEDSIVFERLTNLNDSSIEVQRSKHISLHKSANFDTPLYKRMVSVRPTYIMLYLEKGIDVIYSDLDTVWLKNPLPHLTGHFDIWSHMDSENTFCTGFMAIKSNSNTLKLIKKWADVLQKRSMLNQPVFNNLVRKSSIMIKALNSKWFPTGRQYFDQFSTKERSNVVVVHNNWIVGHDRKVERFQSMNLWFNGTIL